MGKKITKALHDLLLQDKIRKDITKGLFYSVIATIILNTAEIWLLTEKNKRYNGI